MDYDIILLSDDEASVPLTVPENLTVDIADRAPKIASISGSPSPVDVTETGYMASKHSRIDLVSDSKFNDDIDAIFDDPMFGGQGARVIAFPVKADEKKSDTKKTKKNKLEAEDERKRKEKERDQKKQLRNEKKAIEEKDKKLRAIEREISASKKSKAEEFVFCRVGKAALDMIAGFEAGLRVLMADRKIDAQLEIKSELETRIEWWRKSIEAMELDRDRGVERVESMIQEPLEVIIVDAAALASIIKAGALEQHVITLRSSLGVSNALLILLANGKLNVKDSERDAQAVVLHERLKTQLREVHSPNEAALFICQLHRSIARLHVKRSEKIIADVTKGQRDHAGLVGDWWCKMVAMVPRLSGIYARALTAAFPNPFSIMDRIEKEGQEAVEAAIAEVRTDIGNRIGASRARKVIELLTTEDGMELFT